MNTDCTREDLIRIIDCLHLQSVWIRECIDIVEYLSNVNKEKLKPSRNFWHMTKSSLIYRYSIELAKLFDKGKGLSIYDINNRCMQNLSFFNDPSFVTQYCKDFKKELKNHSETVKNLCDRRNKTYGHNDKDYYLFTQKAIDDFPLDFEDIKNLALLIYNFATTLQQNINSTRKELGYPAYYDDVKRLFGEKTEADIWLDSEF